MEANYDEIEEEEIRAAAIGKREDEIERLKQEMEERERKLKKLMKL
jgi:hypothetical protein